MSRIAAVVIGRNEGQRLIGCLRSLGPDVAPVVYVDSGSTDGSTEAARALGAEVVALDLTRPFTAARARNAGLDRVRSLAAAAGLAMPDHIQFVDGDCSLREGWIDTARAFLDAHPAVAVVCGRRRERYPDASVYNRLIDREWDTPVGPARACGGDALIRVAALDAVGGYDATLIAGEEPDLCLRMARLGWQVWRLAAEMTWHDAAITRLGQWWKRSRRAGHAYAEGAYRHGRGPEAYRRAETRRALLWGAGPPLLALVLVPFTGLSGLVPLLAWPAQMLRLALRSGDWTQAAFLVLGKLPEAQGVLGFHLGRLAGRQARLIEYK